MLFQAWETFMKKRSKASHALFKLCSLLAAVPNLQKQH